MHVLKTAVVAQVHQNARPLGSVGRGSHGGLLVGGNGVGSPQDGCTGGGGGGGGGESEINELYYAAFAHVSFILSCLGSTTCIHVQYNTIALLMYKKQSATVYVECIGAVT